jgi:CrcB protein
VEALLWGGVVLLGGVGAIFRTRIGAEVDRRKQSPFPLGTFVVNVSGSLLAGVLYGAGVGGDGELLASTALIGAYTTFSTWMSDSERLSRQGAGQLALLDVFGSLFAGLAAALLGMTIARAF